MVLDGRLGVIDFQDARLGPETYDLASLLRDSYVGLEPEDVNALIARVLSLDRGPLGYAGDAAGFRERFDIMAVQRNLKALGTFGYQASVAPQHGLPWATCPARSATCVTPSRGGRASSACGSLLAAHLPEVLVALIRWRSRDRGSFRVVHAPVSRPSAWTRHTSNGSWAHGFTAIEAVGQPHALRLPRRQRHHRLGEWLSNRRRHAALGARAGGTPRSASGDEAVRCARGGRCDSGAGGGAGTSRIATSWSTSARRRPRAVSTTTSRRPRGAAWNRSSRRRRASACDVVVEVIANPLSNPEALVRLIEEDLDELDLGICLDYGHAHMLGDLAESIETVVGTSDDYARP